MKTNSYLQIFEAQYGNKRWHHWRRSSNFMAWLATKAKHRLVKISELIDQSHKYRVLEIGCADGKFLFKHQSVWQSCVGVDAVASQISRAKQRNWRVKADFKLADYGHVKMPFGDRSFDLVVSAATFQYLVDLNLLFSEISRVLKPAGELIFEVPNSVVFWRRWRWLRGRLAVTTEYDHGWRGGVIHDFTEADLRAFIQKHNLEVISVSTAGLADNWRSWWPDLLGADLIFHCRRLQTS